ncbi:hypothetical protein Q8A73_000455 [Channa argus]|nr:hypothetical protein Q8A73_000455 [Channa argus]
MFMSTIPPDFTLEGSVPSAPGQFTALNEWMCPIAPKQTWRSNNTPIMTKLLEWLFGVSVLGAVWALVTFDLFDLKLPQTYRDVAWPMPLYLLVSFGCYSLATVGYRVATFNDCEEAAKELQEQIKEAQEDLRKKGLKM